MAVLSLLVSLGTWAQQPDVKSDLLLIDSLTIKHQLGNTKREYIYKGQPKTFKTCNPVSVLYGSALYIYQNFVSQHFSADCLYSPSCSDFSKKAVKKYGIIKGGLLTFDRLCRCNRIAATDLDPQTMNKKTHRFDDSVDKYQ